MVLLRHLLGDALRRLRLRQGRTLREVSAAARVSLGYLSEVERGQKEASSELLASICGALGAPLSQLLREVSDNFALAELQSEPVFSGVREPSLDAPSGAGRSPDGKVPVGSVPAGSVPARSVAARPMSAQRAAGSPRPGAPVPSAQRLVVPAAQKAGVRVGQRLVPAAEQVLDTAALPLSEPAFEQVTRSAQDITNMVPV
jgi:transcriptional regulator with XRE-family HTH domain